MPLTNDFTDSTPTATVHTAAHNAIANLVNNGVLTPATLSASGTLTAGTHTSCTGSITATLPTSPATGTLCAVENANSPLTNHTVTVAAGGSASFNGIAGLTTMRLNQIGAIGEYIYDGTNWQIRRITPELVPIQLILGSYVPPNLTVSSGTLLTSSPTTITCTSSTSGYPSIGGSFYVNHPATGTYLCTYTGISGNTFTGVLCAGAGSGINLASGDTIYWPIGFPSGSNPPVITQYFQRGGAANGVTDRWQLGFASSYPTSVTAGTGFGVYPLFILPVATAGQFRLTELDFLVSNGAGTQKLWTRCYATGYASANGYGGGPTEFSPGVEDTYSSTYPIPAMNQWASSYGGGSYDVVGSDLSISATSVDSAAGGQYFVTWYMAFEIYKYWVP